MSKLYEHMAVLLFFLLALVIISFDVLYGTASLIKPSDSFDQSVMWLHKVFNAAEQNELVLWDFTIQSGVSFIGELQTGALYPIALLYGKMGFGRFPSGYNDFILFHYLIASCSAFYLARQFKCNIYASIMAGLLFAFSGSSVGRSVGQANIFFGISYMPLVMLGVIHALTEGEIKYRVLGCILASLAIAFSFLSGHTHPAIIAITVSLIYSPLQYLYTYKQRYGQTPSVIQLIKQVGYPWVFIAIISMLLVLPQLASTLEYMKLAYKWYGPGATTYPHVVPDSEFVKHAISIKDFRSMLQPGVRLDVPDGGELFPTYSGLLVLGAAIGLLVLKKQSQYFFYFKSMMFIFLLLAMFSLGYLYGDIPVLNNIRIPSRWSFGLTMLLALLVAVGLTIIIEYLESAYPKYFNRVVIHSIGTLIVLITLVQLAVYFKAHIQQPTWDSNVATQPLKLPVVSGLYTELAKDLQIHRFFAQREDFPPNLGNIYFNLSSHGFRSSRSVVYHDYFDFQPLGDVVRSLGIKYWITRIDVPGLTPIIKDGPVHIYELPNNLSVLYTKTDVEKNKAPIKSVEWKSNKVIFELSEGITGNIIFAQSYYPGFVAYSGKEFYPVSRDGSLMAVNVFKPIRSLTFEYSPAWFNKAIVISLCTFLVLLVYVARVFLYNTKK